ncbi:hypothetical protein NEICINOT_03948 [Neisseria cinerea ATCC 14685]|uniref:Uncharacterized protein n=1 Tax=Neisseria cinerea ATCC 14685 TaxID=546262 RepID=D0W2R5_NEICI|nr:hypothetical protein NEICINOT_03948 [Neisseria cinerea ATCC 14685]
MGKTHGNVSNRKRRRILTEITTFQQTQSSESVIRAALKNNIPQPCNISAGSTTGKCMPINIT